MNCHTLKAEIVPYHHDELSPQERAEFERHVQVCVSCARLSHALSLAMALSQRTLEQTHEADIASRVAVLLGSATSPLARFRWAFVPGLTIFLVGAIITPTVIRPLPDLYPDSALVAEDLEMFTDYEVLENLDILETDMGQETEGGIL